MAFQDISLIIFDVDGVLVDSEDISCGALSQILLEECGIRTGDDFSAVIGKSNRDAIKYYLGLSGIEYSYEMIEDLEILKSRRYLQLAEKSLVTFPDCEQTIVELSRMGYKMVVASSGNIDKIEFSLSKTGLIRYFSQINSAQEVRKGKPAPDLFLLAANKMGVDPSNCLVIEDSLLGIDAALAAGMKVFGFTSSFDAEQIQSRNISTFDNFNELMTLIDTIKISSD